MAGCLARDKFLLEEHHGDEVAAELLGVDDGAAIRKLIDSLGPGGDGRAQIITLALVLGSLEPAPPRTPGQRGRRRLVALGAANRLPELPCRQRLPALTRGGSHHRPALF